MLRCPYCRREVRTYRGLKAHVLHAHPRPQACVACGEPLRSERGALVHFIKRSGDPAHLVLWSLHARNNGSGRHVRDLKRFAARLLPALYEASLRVRARAPPPPQPPPC